MKTTVFSTRLVPAEYIDTCGCTHTTCIEQYYPACPLEFSAQQLIDRDKYEYAMNWRHTHSFVKKEARCEGEVAFINLQDFLPTGSIIASEVDGGIFQMFLAYDRTTNFLLDGFMYEVRDISNKVPSHELLNRFSTGERVWLHGYMENCTK